MKRRNDDEFDLFKTVVWTCIFIGTPAVWYWAGRGLLFIIAFIWRNF